VGDEPLDLGSASVTPPTTVETTWPAVSAPLEDAGSTEVVEDDGDPDAFFRDDVIHEIVIDISDASWGSLTYLPREYAAVTFTADDGPPLSVAIRLKGNTQYRELDDKPSLVIDFNRFIEDQEFHGMPSVYLHNMTYDPTMMHEHLAYRYFRMAGAPAARTTYAHLTINGEDYGLYLFVEKQNRVYLAEWWDDTSGAVYETGSFNWGCDLDDGGASPCDCFELDDLNDDDPTAIERLCEGASAAPHEWYDSATAVVDMPAFVHSMATEMVASHYDNYGYNKNNFRVYHERERDRWYFTPWSTDLAFGWYPWSGDPHCGEVAGRIADYGGGYLLGRCAGDTTCRAELYAALETAADAFEDAEMGEEVDRLHAMISDSVRADARRWYDDIWFEREVDCLRDFVAARPDAVRGQL